MTPIDLLDALADFCEDKTADMKLETSHRRGEPVRYRAPIVYRMDVPKKEDEERTVPYIIIQILTGKDEQPSANEPCSVVNIRIVASAFSEDMGEGKLNVLNVLDRIRLGLLERKPIGGHFVLTESIEWAIDPRSVSTYHFGEMLVSFEMPPIYPESSSLSKFLTRR